MGLVEEARRLRQAGRAAEALAASDAALAENPADPNAHAVRGNALMDLGRLEEALAACDAVVALAPSVASAHANRGNVLMKLARFGEAAAAFEAAAGLQPTAAFHNNLGAALLELGRTEPALEAYGRAVALAPSDPQAHANRAAALLKSGRVEAAEAALAVAPGPAAPLAHWNLALGLLARGRYASGWAQYEHRWRAEHFLRESKGQTTPELRAQFRSDLAAADLAGRALLVGEQGVGDVLMFASLVPDLLRDAGAVSLLVDRRLKRLFAHAFPEVRVLEPGEALPARDVTLPIGALARLYRRRLEDFPGTPYLSASDAARRRWAERLGPKARRLRVGLAWRGGTEATRQASRSLPLTAFGPLLAREDCEFVSLQYGDAQAEAAGLPVRVFPAPDLEDFDDQAGLIQALDVVVSVQTAVVHLAGALGQRALVLLPNEPEWRYAAQAETMPWYRSVRLLRQDQPGEWDSVIRRVAEAL